MRGGWVCILTNKPDGSLYVGVTADLAQRLTAHREGRGSRHAHRYNLDKLVLAEPYSTMPEAIAREKQLKAWRREWKLMLIRQTNPGWDDLSAHVIDASFSSASS